jgi:signal transduction histidine kinase
MESVNCLPPELVQEGFYKSVAIFSHLIPVVLLLLSWVGIAIANRKSTTKGNSSAALLTFTLLFALWMLGDLVTWQGKPREIAAAWASLDLLNLLFFAAGTYYALRVIGKNPRGVTTILLALVPLPAFIHTGLGTSITGFDFYSCEAIEHPWLSQYRTFADFFVIALLSFQLGLTAWRKQVANWKAFWFAAIPTLVFLVGFSLAEYISVVLENYDLFLYYLLGTPVLLAPIVFFTVRYELARFSRVGVSLLSVLLVFITVLDYLLAENFAQEIVALCSVVLVSFLSWILITTIKREATSRSRAEILAHNLETANLRLLELDKQKSEFVSLASHQLRGPITAINGYASMLNEGDYGQVPVSAMEILGRIQKSSHDMAVLITDYLDVTRIELGKVKYQPERFSFRDLVSEVEKELAPNVPQGKVTLNVEEGADPRFVFADRTKVKQVIMNLVDNAVKYTPHGEVRATLTRREGYARFEVKDNGVGINPESLPHLFQKFSRAKNASKTNIKGTGLGLYIAKTIADYHRGHLTAQSEGEGKGSTFIFELPLADEQAPSAPATA